MKEIDKEALKANKVLSIKDVEADLKEIEKFNWRNNINYKLKDFVTDEMLVECGFEVSRYTHVSYAVREIKNEDCGLYIGLSKKACFSFGMRYIEFDNGDRDDDDITPYIQDLIEKGYVEVLK